MARKRTSIIPAGQQPLRVVTLDSQQEQPTGAEFVTHRASKGSSAYVSKPEHTAAAAAAAGDRTSLLLPGCPRPY
ncbi:hypothetical protein OEZ85_006901 [Tetradesmus obliquus]|uniref:Uncharacterized protein n=1 Tax=Tetradesmus obliquus TaxID=3088 RepID=A0ABY8TW00_TETOB|nr:hypothetical protein OEZ85_006901 [Tetradesmus obliquus]